MTVFSEGGNPEFINADCIGYFRDIRYDEALYIQITKDILDKYPILVNGTVAQQKSQQLKQILALNKWFSETSSYSTFKDLGNYDESKGPLVYLLRSALTGELKSTDNYGSEKVDEYVAEDFRNSKKWYVTYNTEETGESEIAAYLKYHNFMLSNTIASAQYMKDNNVKFWGICGGFADLYEYAARQMGIDSQTVTSDIHAWNAVRFADGSIMYIDEALAARKSPRIMVLNDSWKSDMSIGSVIRSGYVTDVKESNKRLSTLIGSFEDSDSGYNLPIGDSRLVFETEEFAKTWYAALMACELLE